MFRPAAITQITQKLFQCRAIHKWIKNATSNSKHFLILEKNNFLTYNSRVLSHAAKTEREFLVRLKNDPDTFGDADVEEIPDEGDIQEEKHFEEQAAPSQKLRTKQYADMIKAFIRNRKIKEAIDVVEVKMLKEDQVKPEAYIYNLLLGACGRVGYTKKAFSLYNQMKKRGLNATGGTYTALFNACANSPWADDGLTRAKHLYNIMIEKMYEPNVTNYNAMIKAFGRCGDLPMAFSLVDEMKSKRMPIKSETMNFLFQACIQDKDAGFRHALLVWRKMMEKNIAPNNFTFNLMLRCIRDCGIGDVQVMIDTLDTLVPKIQQSDNKLLESSSNDKLIQTELETTVEEKSLVGFDMLRPNLMAKVPHLGNIVSCSEITKAEDRLLLVGGFKGFLNTMTQLNCSPDIKTFTQMLDCLPGNLPAEQELLKAMKKANVKPDIDFFNMLIKKRSMRFDYDSGKKVLEEMHEYKYRPNLITYGVLALGCKTKQDARNLLEEMRDHSYRLNTEILGAMLHQACHHKNFSYVLEIMEISLRENVKPNKKFMKQLEDFQKDCKKISNDKEHKLCHSASFQKGFKVFQMRYKTWVEEVEVDDSEDVHPWTQYRQRTETDTRHYKDKDDRFKAQHTSLFKVKTSKKHLQKNKRSVK